LRTKIRIDGPVVARKSIKNGFQQGIRLLLKLVSHELMIGADSHRHKRLLERAEISLAARKNISLGCYIRKASMTHCCTKYIGKAEQG
jgi:hypothetical protein